MLAVAIFAVRSLGGVQIIAHRGSTAADRPENSLAAVAAALDGGADGVEVDVRLTADGVAVCSHDRDLRRVTGEPLVLATTPWRDLRRLTVGGEPAVPRLAEVAESVRGRGRLIAEVKSGAGGAARTAAAVLPLARLLPDLRLTVSSFDPVALTTSRLAEPRLPVALLTGPGVPLGQAVQLAARLGCLELHPHVSDALLGLAEAGLARALGVALTVWTVDNPALADRFRTADLDAVMTDDLPALRAPAIASPHP